jgi:hypothetical protein
LLWAAGGSGFGSFAASSGRPDLPTVAGLASALLHKRSTVASLRTRELVVKQVAESHNAAFEVALGERGITEDETVGTALVGCRVSW